MNLSESRNIDVNNFLNTTSKTSLQPKSKFISKIKFEENKFIIGKESIEEFDLDVEDMKKMNR